jgi:valyl-tRNA synthetase
MESIPKNYDHSIESKWAQYWIDNKTFSDKTKEITKDDYVLVIPPPNVTGKLHIGHALNNTYQDILLRTNKMKGKKCIWVPGTDHAGIATQTKVEKILIEQYESEGKKFNKDEMGKEAFISEIWNWKNQYGNSIINQLKRLGCGCDWDRIQFTMNPQFSDLVKRIFVKLYNDDLIYRSEYIVNWCPVSKTALANEEVIYEDQKSELYYLRYYYADENDKPIKDKYLVVATTRPETILGDVAVAFSPKDERYKELENQTLLVPLINRSIKLIKDIYPNPDFGTGLVKITPAHDVNDFKVGQRHKLPKLKILDEDAKIYNTGTRFDGMDRFEAREEILKDLDEKGFLEKRESYKNRIGRSYRSGAIVESLLSKQWFVRMEPLAKMVLEHEDEINFYPKYQKEIFKNWLNNIQDWCISRQILWGHRIPVWYGSDGSIVCDTVAPNNTKHVEYTQDSDVLDTWFSAWLWPIGVFPDKESIYRNNINVLTTGADILFFWVIRMMMASCYLTKELPFKDIYLHGLIRDENNEKMSKSKGNVIDPLEVIDDYSADAIRFSLTMKTPYGQDVPFSDKDVELGRNFATKLWNTMRYIVDISQLSRHKFKELGKHLPSEFVDYLYSQVILTESTTLETELDGFDLWIIGQLSETIRKVEEHIGNYNFSAMASTIYTFTWDKFCSIYLETTKYQKDDIKKQFVLNYILNNIIKLVHPIMPFVTEEIWYQLSFCQDINYKSIVESADKQSIYLVKSTNDELVNKYMKLVKHIRSIKSVFGIPLNRENPETKTKEKFIHGNIILNNINLELLCFIENNKTYLIKDTNINNTRLDKGKDKRYYEVKNDDMVILYEVDEYFKFDNKIKVIESKINNVDKKIKIIQNKLEKTKSENKMKKLDVELSKMFTEISKLKTELDYYNNF